MIGRGDLSPPPSIAQRAADFLHQQPGARSRCWRRLSWKGGEIRALPAGPAGAHYPFSGLAGSSRLFYCLMAGEEALAVADRALLPDFIAGAERYRDLAPGRDRSIVHGR